MSRILILFVISTIGHHNRKISISSGAVLTLIGFALIHIHSELIVLRWAVETLGGAVQFLGLVPFVDPLTAPIKETQKH